MLFAKAGFQPPAEEEAAPAEAAELDRSDLEAFKQALVAALSNPERTPESLQPFMSDPHLWAGWQSEGTEQPLADVLVYLADEALPAPDAISYNPDTNLAELLAGQDPQGMFPTGVDFMHMEAWWTDGTGEALLIIGQDADGLYTWSGTLNAPGGFGQ
jgi:hypothetical protein